MISDKQADDAMCSDGQRVRLSRRTFLLASGAGAAALVTRSVVRSPSAAAATATAAASGAATGAAAVRRSFNDGWLFGLSTSDSTDPGFDDSDLLTVTLPHNVAQLSWQQWVPSAWEQVWVYRKHFDAPADTDGMRIFVDFAAAMTASVVTLNGQQVGEYAGGYLPFSVEITGALRPKDNVLAVTLNSTFDIDVPPDVPGSSSSYDDFWQSGGIYRDVTLRVVPAVYLSDVFAKPVNVLDPGSRQVVVEATVDAAAAPAGTCQLQVVVLDGMAAIASATVPAAVTAGKSTVTATVDGLDRVTLWDVDNPKLYTVVATLLVDGYPLHDYQVRTGFRDISFTTDRFFLNGERVKLFGVGRHQFFPFAAGAMPGRVQRRDAQILRQELNCNFVRCVTYLHSPAFLDACDELGLMVWEEIPGFSYFGDAAWQAAAQQDVHDMIVRDRNHPATIVWDCMPNESGVHDAQYDAWNALAHSLDDSRPTGGDITAEQGTDYPFDVFSNHDYSYEIGPDGLREPLLGPPTDAAGKPYVVCEAVGSISGPAAAYQRTSPQSIQQGQAIAHARVHDISFSDDRYCGLAAWSGYDYESGAGSSVQGVKYNGVVDLFREPKPGAAIYQAQVDPAVRPVIAPAFYWDFGPTSPVNQLGPAMICSNLDSLQVFVAGTFFATTAPDTTDYGSLPYPPSFVDFSSVSGDELPELRIDGYLNGNLVASRTFSSDPSGDRLAVAADDTRLLGDGSDTTRVVFRAVDRYGNSRPYVTGDVTLSVRGPAMLVGDNPFAFADTGGVGAVWIRSVLNSPGTVRVIATHPTLGSGQATITVAQPSPSGPPAPFGQLAIQPPSALPGGQSSTIAVAFTNHGLIGLDRVTVTIEPPQGWQATAISSGTFAGVHPDQSVTSSWSLAVPSDTEPGFYDLTAGVVYTGAGQRGVGTATTSVLVELAGAVPQSVMTATATSFQPGYEPALAIDGNPATFWHTEFSPVKVLPPQSITLALGGSYDVTGLVYLPRQDGILNGTISEYNIYSSIDGTTFTLADSGAWAADDTQKTASFTATGAQYIQLEGVQAVNDNVSAAEINILGTPS